MAKNAKEEESPLIEKVDLSTYLDTLVLTRAEKLFYMRTYGRAYELLTREEWKKKIKLVHR